MDEQLQQHAIRFGRDLHNLCATIQPLTARFDTKRTKAKCLFLLHFRSPQGIAADLRKIFDFSQDLFPSPALQFCHTEAGGARETDEAR
jgi:hypothetical protein